VLPSNPIRWLVILVGLGSISGGIAYLMSAEGDEVGQALLILIPFGIAMIVAGFSEPSDPGSVEGVEARDGATVFNPLPARRATSIAGMAGFLCLGLGMVFFPGDSPDTDQGTVRGIGTVIALGFGALVFFSLRAMRRGHMVVTLTPELLRQRGRLKEIEVRWDEITDVSLHRWRGTVHTVLQRAGMSVMVPHQAMAADPAVFHAVVEHMHAHPGDRGLLSTPGGREALGRLGLRPAHAGDGEEPEQGDPGGHDGRDRADVDR
jgi:hypothetical protein